MKPGVERDAGRFLIFLIIIDAFLIVLHILHTYTALLPGTLFSIEKRVPGSKAVYV